MGVVERRVGSPIRNGKETNPAQGTKLSPFSTKPLPQQAKFRRAARFQVDGVLAPSTGRGGEIKGVIRGT